MEQIVGNSSEAPKWETWEIVIKDIQPFLGKDYAGGSRGGQGGQSAVSGSSVQ